MTENSSGANFPTPDQVGADRFWAAVLEILDNQFRYWDEMGFVDVGNGDYQPMELASLTMSGFPVIGELKVNGSLATYIKSLLLEQLAVPAPKNFDQEFIQVYQAFIFTMFSRNAESQALELIQELSGEY